MASKSKDKKDGKKSKSSKSSSKQDVKRKGKDSSPQAAASAPAEEPVTASASSSSMPASSSSSPTLTSSSSTSKLASSSHPSSSHLVGSSSGAASSSAGDIQPEGLTHEISLRPEFQKFADVHFTLSGGETLFAHSWVLNYRCAKLFELVNKKRGPLKKGQKRKFAVTTIDFTNFHIAHAFVLNKDALSLTLSFLYADNLVIGELEPLRVMHLAMAARTFEIPRLLRLCEIRLQSCLTMENVFGLLKVAHENREKVIRDFCMDFAHRNIKVFVSHREELKDLGIDLMQEIMDISLEEYVERPRDDSPPPDSTLLVDFQRLWDATYSGEEWSDAFVQIGTARIPFHKAMFAAHTKAFASIFPPSGAGDDVTELLCLCPPSKGKDPKTVVIKLEPETFLCLTRYIYYGCTQIDPLLACNLAPFLPKFQLLSLQKVCQHTISTNIKPDTVLGILKVAYMPEYADREDIKTIKAEALHFCATHGKAIQLEPLINMDPNISVDILKTIQNLA